MSIRTTPFLHLPQWTAEEQPSFLGEINPAWASIDQGYGDIKTDSATAITTANAAVNTANAAEQQSQANAGAITQLQKRLTLLENSFNNAQTLVSDTPVISNPINGVNAEGIQFYHNGFAAWGHFRIGFNVGTHNITANTPVFNVSGLPYVWREVSLSSDETFGPYTNISLSPNIYGYNALGFVLKANGDVTTTANIEIRDHAFGIDIEFCLPIFRTANISRENIPNQCFVLIDTDHGN